MRDAGSAGDIGLGSSNRQLLELFELGGRYPAIVGDAAQVADELQSWIDETGVDLRPAAS